MEATIPQAEISEAAAPETAKPEAAKPEATKPEATKLAKSHIYICILAAIVVVVGFLIQTLVGRPPEYFTMALSLSVCIVVFYFLGHIARHVLQTQIFPQPEEPEAPAEGAADIPVEGMVFGDAPPGAGVDPNAFAQE